MPIRKLSPLLVSQIAAGEVIERPSSVVKELVENSLDAGATRIEITVEDGGRQLIKVSDNGFGILADELSLAIEPHATSKLQASDQLAAIGTLGFRGEALASAASVSRLRITSRATLDGQADESGWQIKASGDQISEPRPQPCAPGTIIEVRDLFFNTPARRKFMRRATTEFAHINETIRRLSIVQRHVGFTLTHNNRKSMALTSQSSWRQRCVDVLGKELDEAMLGFEHVEQSVSENDSPMMVWGLAGQPSIARATTKHQFICLNGRPIRDRSISHAIKEAYRGLIPHDKQPVVVLFIEVDPAAVDVNVHPTKGEVRFRESSRMHSLIITILRQHLLGSDLTPTTPITSHTPFSIDRTQCELLPASAVSTGSTSRLKRQNSNFPTTDFVEYFKQMDPKQKGFAYELVKEALVNEQPQLESLPEHEAGSQQPSPLRTHDILQVHKSYVVTEDEQGIVIVDQHALHERVMFEELAQRVLNQSGKLESQRMLMPIVIKVTMAQLTALGTMKTLLARIGIEAEPISSDAVAIQAFPSFLFDRKVDPSLFFEDLLDKAQEGHFNFSNPKAEEAVLCEVLDMMACKAAIKAGDRMSDQELSELLTQRDQVERSSNCPHGRPTSIRLTLRDLEKHFMRT